MGRGPAASWGALPTVVLRPGLGQFSHPFSSRGSLCRDRGIWPSLAFTLPPPHLQSWVGIMCPDPGSLGGACEGAPGRRGLGSQRST